MTLPTLPAQPIPWLSDLLDDAERCRALLDRWGSPLHLHRPDRLPLNAGRYLDAAAAAGVDLDLFFARKANKALSYVDHARAAGLGVDVASENELRQAIDRGVEGARIVVTAAVKSPDLLRLAARHGACVVIDHPAEVAALREVARAVPDHGPVEVALRLRGFQLPGGHHTSRFGVSVEELPTVLESLGQGQRDGLATVGLHFHLDGYAAMDRAAAIDQCITLGSTLRQRGLPIRFIDMGGGFPVQYAAEADHWELFLETLDGALLGERPPITFGNTGFGRLRSDEGTLAGRPAVYPHAQSPVGAAWMESILTARRAKTDQTVGKGLIEAELTLRAEPGRALLDSCGATLARVEFVKSGAGAEKLVGVAMNGSNCRTRKSELLTDPWHVMAGGGGEDAEECEGYLVGAWCAEDDLITSRRLAFPHGVAPDDLIVFPNTAGYYMHFVESRSHQLPLPNNVVLGTTADDDRLDDIDRISPD